MVNVCKMPDLSSATVEAAVSLSFPFRRNEPPAAIALPNAEKARHPLPRSACTRDSRPAPFPLPKQRICSAEGIDGGARDRRTG